MTAIAMTEITPETVAIEAEVVGTMTGLIPDILQIPLTKLLPGKANVRRTKSTLTIPELAESIAAHGLIQNLTVRKARKGGKYEVIAGERRLAALQWLARQGRIDAAALIPCHVRTRDGSDTEISLAENTQREAMGIVDEVLAYRQLIEEGMTPDTIAARFGQSVVTVRQRLKLAHLSLKILDVLREDAITIEQAKALAISDDHAAQESAWFDAPAWRRDPRSIRAALTNAHVRSDEKLAQFVGIEAYEAAGGAILRDLFAETGNTYLTDRPLLVKLATERLEQAAEPLKIKGWKWVQVSLEAPSIYGGGFGRIHPLEDVPTEAEQSDLASLDAQFDTIAARLEDYAEGDPAIEADEAALAGIEQRIETIRSAAKVYDTAEKALAGCIVAIGHSGALQVEMGLVRAEDMKALRRLRQPEAVAGDDADRSGATLSPSSGSHDDEDAQLTAYSAALVEELTAIRTAAMRNALVNRPELALAFALYPLVTRVFYSGPRHWRVGTAVEIGGEVKDLSPCVKEPDTCPALDQWNRTHETWGYKLPGDPGDLWEMLLEMTDEDRLELLAVVTAANINAVEARHDHSRDRLAHADQLAAALKLDMRQNWEAKALFLSRLSKTQIVEVMTEAGCSGDAVKAVSKAQKAEAVALAEAALRGKSWLPVLLRSRDENDDMEAIVMVAE
ncbi:ParB family chromosome partitioning protein [Rhizobium sp. PP-F2F-G38]|nr:ParB family chromosome partitioning protein [Rhizobium sp. PP-WC-1G-195]PYE92730.1 ParB family chromosome partitioning protein [Rhizobium sp. PP-F2F-G38]TCL89647.1 ParB family chromosome partitioning protein [Rhizobium sp. PP-WC-2G-219]TCP77251.1 ParB family chromosome partitioning protein [Rhizobium sp. PP-CC-2G-626]TCQ03338.1 ParB family chromosome partitioning protein [Rhizobium sp. PP-F2F-G36]